MNRTVRFYRRKLPHWEKENATYFITFRVAGSLPRHLADQAEFEIKSIAQRLKSQVRPTSDYEMERLAICEKYLDQDRTNPVLEDPRLASIIRQTIIIHHRKKYNLLAWCIMSNHVHLLLTPLRQKDETTAGVGGVPFSPAEIVHSIKSYTAKQAKKLGIVDGNLWQREYFDRWARNDGELERYHDYIRQNPMLAGRVKNPDDYPWQGGTPPTLGVEETSTTEASSVSKLQ